MAKKKTFKPLQQFNYRIPDNDMIAQWFNNQDTGTNSITTAILLAIGEYGTQDLPTAVAVKQAEMKNLVKDQAHELLQQGKNSGVVDNLKKIKVDNAESDDQGIFEPSVDHDDADEGQEDDVSKPDLGMLSSKTKLNNGLSKK